MSAVPSSHPRVVAPIRRRHLHLVPITPSVEAHPVGNRAVYVRRRFAALAALVVLLAGALLAAKAFAGGPSGADVVVTVRGGETLSEIAARELPSVRTDRAVVRLQEANNLNSMHVEAGQRLLVPER